MVNPPRLVFCYPWVWGILNVAIAIPSTLYFYSELFIQKHPRGLRPRGLFYGHQKLPPGRTTVRAQSMADIRMAEVNNLLPTSPVSHLQRFRVIFPKYGGIQGIFFKFAKASHYRIGGNPWHDRIFVVAIGKNFLGFGAHQKL